MSEPRPWMAPFLAELRAGRSVRVACDMARVPYRTAYHYRHIDRAFRAAWDRARGEVLIGHSLPLAS